MYNILLILYKLPLQYRHDNVLSFFAIYISTLLKPGQNGPTTRGYKNTGDYRPIEDVFHSHNPDIIKNKVHFNFVR